MRHAVLAIAILALAACGEKTPPEGQADSGLAAAFPNLTQASFRADATITDPEGKAMPVVMIRSGDKMRIELQSGAEQQIIIVNPEINQSIIIAQHGGQRMAMTVASSDIPNAADEWQSELASSATRTGVCSGAGESGAEWTANDQEGGPKTACVTDDGIILKATENGVTTWETTRVQRGAQAAELFLVPEGVQVMDLGSMLSPEMIDQMKAQMGQ